MHDEVPQGDGNQRSVPVVGARTSVEVPSRVPRTSIIPTASDRCHGLCLKTGKLSYNSHGAARRAQFHAQKRAPDGILRASYHCAHCGLYHFGQTRHLKKHKASARRRKKKLRGE